MNKNTNGERNILIIIIFIILIIVGYVLFNIFTSKNALRNNSPNSSNAQKQTEEIKETPYIKDNTNNISKNSSALDNNLENDSNKVKPIEEKKEEIIATFSTSIYDKDENRVSNITLANSKLNGIIVKSGEEFSFNNTIGPMDETQGFKKALGFDSKRKKNSNFWWRALSN